jgi:hypothetical protein
LAPAVRIDRFAARISSRLPAVSITTTPVATGGCDGQVPADDVPPVILAQHHRLPPHDGHQSGGGQQIARIDPID